MFVQQMTMLNINQKLLSCKEILKIKDQSYIETEKG